VVRNGKGALRQIMLRHGLGGNGSAVVWVQVGIVGSCSAMSSAERLGIEGRRRGGNEGKKR